MKTTSFSGWMSTVRLDPAGIFIETQGATSDPSATRQHPEASDLLIGAPSSGGQILVLVAAKLRAAPRDVEALLGGPWRRWRRQMGNQPILLVAPYVGERVGFSGSGRMPSEGEAVLEWMREDERASRTSARSLPPLTVAGGRRAQRRTAVTR